MSIIKHHNGHILQIKNLFSKKDFNVLKLMENENENELGILTYDTSKISIKSFDFVINKLRNINNKDINKELIKFNNSEISCFALKYDDFCGIGQHTDGWSSMNLTVSIGHSALFKTDKSCFTIEHGDIVIFNGGIIKHSVKILIDNSFNFLNTYYRIVLQYRVINRKSKRLTKSVMKRLCQKQKQKYMCTRSFKQKLWENYY